MRDQRLRWLTRDDRLVQELIDRGALTEDEARRHPDRSVVLQALDGVERPLPEVRAVEARAGDRLLLCSDGATDYLADAKIAKLLRIKDPAVAVRRLVDCALEHGSRDNITAIIADVVTRSQPCDRWRASAPGSGLRRLRVARHFRNVAHPAVWIKLPLCARSGSRAGVTALGVKQQSRHLDRVGLTLLLRNGGSSGHIEPSCFCIAHAKR
jgi:hypothetical protein